MQNQEWVSSVGEVGLQVRADMWADCVGSCSSFCYFWELLKKYLQHPHPATGIHMQLAATHSIPRCFWFHRTLLSGRDSRAVGLLLFFSRASWVLRKPFGNRKNCCWCFYLLLMSKIITVFDCLLFLSDFPQGPSMLSHKTFWRGDSICIWAWCV